MTDYTLGDTVYILFTTRQYSNGQPATLSGTPVLSVYRNGSITQITAGVSVTADFDGVTGLNLATVVATSGNGYASGDQCDIVITTGTVGGTSVVGEVVGGFTLNKSAAAVDLANGTDGLGAIKTDTAAILDDTGTNGVIVATNNDKTGYSLTQAFPTNFSSLAITGGGAVTAGTVSDKTGYSLTQTFPANFADLAIEVTTGRVDVGKVSGTAQTANDNGADINAILVDTNNLNDTAISELGVGIPTATPTLQQAVMLLYMALRNKLVVNSSTNFLEIYNDAGTLIAKKSLTDVASVYTEAEMVSG